MNNYLSYLRWTIVPLFCWSLSLAAEPGVSLFKSGEDFESTRENLEMAIMDQGLTVTSTLHISEMLNRTGPDLGFEQPVYIKAESLEFCSALLSHKMVQADPLNLTICPFTIAIFIKSGEPEQVYVAHRNHQLAGAPGPKKAAATKAVNDLLSNIVHEAID